MEEKWLNNVRNKMESHEVSEPLGLWDDIELALKEKKSAPIINYRKVLLWSASIGSIAAMLTLIFFIGKEDSSFLTIPTNIEPPTANQYTQEPNTNKTNNNIIEQIDEKKNLFATITPSYNKQQASNNKEQTFVVISEREEILDKFKNDHLVENQLVDEEKSDQKQSESAKENQSEKNGYFPNGRRNYESIDNYTYRRRSKIENKLTASIYSNNLSNTSGNSNDYGELIAKTTLPGQISGSDIEEQGPVGDIIFSNLGEETYTKVEHKQPVKAGLSIRYQINDKFGIESGLTYTHLSSNLTSGTAKNFYEIEQSLQYIGIPLNLTYNVWDNKQLSFYVSTGGLVEKFFAGKTHTDYIVDNKIISTDDEKIKEKALQFSVNGSVGLQYNLSSKLGLFAEPGLAYYINNGSSIKTIYKEKPMNFNLKIGLRVVLK